MEAFLAGIPFWVYAIVLVITFVLMHAMFFVQRTEAKNRTFLFIGRIGSSFILLAGLLIIDPGTPGSILIALLIAALAGFVSGRSAPPVKPIEPRTAPVAEETDLENTDSVVEEEKDSADTL